MQPTQTAHPRAAAWLAAFVGSLALLAISPAVGRADESNPNNYNCPGSISAGAPEEGSTEQQVKYAFHCNGPITGYQIQAQVPLTGIQSPPLVTSVAGAPLTDTFSCSGDVPGYALNCVGAAKAGAETITGQFAIAKKLCVEPRVDPLLTVVYAAVEKGVVTQAISGPFDLGRPNGCRPDAYNGSTRLEPHPMIVTHHKRHGHKKKGRAHAGERHAR